MMEAETEGPTQPKRVRIEKVDELNDVTLYSRHEIKDELVIGPVVLQKPDITHIGVNSEVADNGTHPDRLCISLSKGPDHSEQCENNNNASLTTQPSDITIKVESEVLDGDDITIRKEASGELNMTNVDGGHFGVQHTQSSDGYMLEVAVDCIKLDPEALEADNMQVREDACTRLKVLNVDGSMSGVQHAQSSDGSYKIEVTTDGLKEEEPPLDMQPITLKAEEEPLDTIHMQIDDPNTANKDTIAPFSCDICNKQFNLKRSLNTHLIIHMTKKTFSCDICNKQFCSEYNLKTHCKVVHKKKPYSCIVCNKKFGCKFISIVHLVAHAKEKPFTCVLCNEQFDIKRHLSKHLLVHAKRKRLSCDICHREFDQKEKSNKKSHLAVLAKEAPLSCDDCNERALVDQPEPPQPPPAPAPTPAVTDSTRRPSGDGTDLSDDNREEPAAKAGPGTSRSHQRRANTGRHASPTDEASTSTTRMTTPHARTRSHSPPQSHILTDNEPTQHTGQETHAQTTPSVSRGTQVPTDARIAGGLDDESDEECDGGDVTREVSSRDTPDDDETDEDTARAMSESKLQMQRAQDALLGDNLSFEWSEDYNSFRGTRKEFTPAGTPRPIGDFDVAHHAFVAIWDRSIMEKIATETNRFADQFISGKRARNELPKASPLREWKATTVEELYLLFAIFIYMGIDLRKTQSEYWETSTVLEMSRFRQLMSYGRYVLLSKFLHFVDNTNVDQASLQGVGTVLDTKLYKLSPVIQHLNSTFPNLYVLAEDIVIAESLNPFNGQLSWIHAWSSKAASFGIKSFELCELHSGYLYKFQFYSGKGTGDSSALHGRSTQVVLDLLQGLEGQGYCVTMDYIYNSPALARYLRTVGFDCLGTLRQNRKHMPEDIKELTNYGRRGNWMAHHSGDVSIFAWKQSKMVLTVSTFHDDSFVLSERFGVPMMMPKCVRDYNLKMGAVEDKGQMLSAYLGEGNRGVKWYVKMFKRLLNVSIHNAYILWAKSRNAKGLRAYSSRAFRFQLAEQLVELGGNRPVERPPRTELLLRLRRDILHIPSTFTVGDGNVKRRCVRCSALGVVSQVPSACTTCGVGICLDKHKNCWLEYHSLKELNVSRNQ